MFDVANGVIRITKGDTAVLQVDLKYPDGSEYEMQSGDTLTLTVRRRPNFPILLEKISTTNIISLEPEQTKNLEVGTCCFDIQLTTADGSIYTVVGLTDKYSTNMVVYAEITE